MPWRSTADITVTVSFSRTAINPYNYFDLSCDQLFTPGRYPAVVQARIVLCFLAVRELGLTATELARQMGLTQPAISISIKRCEGIVRKEKLNIDDLII